MRVAAVLLPFVLTGVVLAGPTGSEFALDVQADDEAGAPLAGVRVEAFAVRDSWGTREDAATWDEVLDPARRPRTPDASGTCGADGRAHLAGLSPLAWTFVASAPGRAAERRTVVVPGFHGPLRFTLRAARPLDGRVLDEAGKPLAGATVVAAWGEPVYGHGLPPVSPFDAWTHADGEGRWHLDDVPDDVVRLYASPPGTWSDRERTIVTLDARRVDIEVPVRGPIVGTVRDEETGKPVPNAVVEISQHVGWFGRAFTRATADASGRYVVPEWPERGITQIEARAPGLRSAMPAISIEIALPATGPATHDAVVRAGAMLSGRVLDAGGPVAGAWVWLRRKGRMPELATTDAAGRYAFPAQVGGLVIVGVASGTSSRSAMRANPSFGLGDPKDGRSVTLPERGSVELDLPAPPAPGPRLCGVVVDEDGAPVPYADVATSHGLRTGTGGDGSFELPSPGVGPTTLTVTEHGFRPLVLADVRSAAATAASPLVVRIEHERRVRVRGIVRAPDGRPATRGRVLLSEAARGADWVKDAFRVRETWGSWTRLRAEGSFDVSISQDEKTIVCLAVLVPGCAPAFFEVPDAAPGAAPDAVRTLNVGLDAGATIRGRVISAAAKKPVAGARILLQPDSLRGMSDGPAPVTYASTGDDGTFAIHDLPPGEAELTVVATAFGTDSMNIEIASAGKGATITADFVLPAAGNEFRRGRVPSWIGPPRAVLVDEEGAPLAGWTVEGYADAGDTRLDPKSLVRATSDAEGHFEFPGAQRVTNLLAYAPPATKLGPRELYPPEVPPYSADDTCKTYAGEIVSFEVVDENGDAAKDIAYTIDEESHGRRQWSERCRGEHLCMNGLRPDARVAIHVEKPGFQSIDVKDVPAGTARMRLVLKRSPPK